jgi:hypothetical protein
VADSGENSLPLWPAEAITLPSGEKAIDSTAG